MLTKPQEVQNIIAKLPTGYHREFQLVKKLLFEGIDLTKEIKVLFYTHDLEPGNQDAVEAGIDGFQIVEASTLLPVFFFQSTVPSLASKQYRNLSRLPIITLSPESEGDARNGRELF